MKGIRIKNERKEAYRTTKDKIFQPGTETYQEDTKEWARY
jgi:hypothetical protein